MSKLIVDTHIHPKMAEDQLFTEMKRADVARCVLLAIDTDPSDIDRKEVRDKIISRFLASEWSVLITYPELEEVMRKNLHSKVTNQDVANWVKNHPDKFIGLGSVNLSKNEEYVEKKLKEINELNLGGIKLLPPIQFFNPAENENMKRVCEFCEDNDKIILYHTGCCPGPWEIPELSEDANPKYLKPIVREFRRVPIILAHIGCYSAFEPCIWLDEALNLGKNHDNVWADVAAVTHILNDEAIVKRIRETIGMDKILFGSDYPGVAGANIKSMIDAVRNAKPLTAKERVKVLGLNAIRLFKLD